MDTQIIKRSLVSLIKRHFPEYFLYLFNIFTKIFIYYVVLINYTILISIIVFQEENYFTI